MMTTKNFLSEIIERKRQRLAGLKGSRPLEEVREEAERVRRAAQAHAFHAALDGGGSRVKIIAEYKRASPSKGVIRADLSPADVARAYGSGGAAAISVLTEEDYFQGSLDDLRAVVSATMLPVLRKDFIVDEYQVYESAAAGASALLLIVAALADDEINSLRRLAEEELSMDVLLEVHTEDEMMRARDCGAKIIGVNNRDLHTFEVMLDTSVRLSRHAPGGALLVSESGFKTRSDIRSLQTHGYGAFLIGETLMRAEHPEETLRGLVALAEAET
ncbi:MAG: indole-3-glycerol phosphate synthase TrpC [Acidobacteria bacterium]|nr:indole-3-glycerol phosphate synthase TrpC [Acidobacteriota bacterium]